MNKAAKVAELLAPQSAQVNDQRSPMVLNEEAIEAARHQLDDCALTLHNESFRVDLVKLLNDSLATELLCVLRYKRHHFTAQGLASPKIAEEFLVHASEEAVHAEELKDWLAD